MSLDFDFSKVANFNEVCKMVLEQDSPYDGLKKGDRVMRGETKTLIFTLGQMGAGRITEKNVETLIVRYELYQKLNGKLLHGTVKGEDGVERVMPIAVDAKMIRAHIGLTTNWMFKDESDATWARKVMANAIRETTRRNKDRARVAAQEAAQAEADAQDDPDAGTECCEECGAVFRPRGGGVTCNCYDDDQQ